MIRNQGYYQDNRDSGQMYEYLESRIEVLKQRLGELEIENATLKCQIEDSRDQSVPTYA